MEQLAKEPSPQRNNSGNILKSTELSGTHVKEMPTISSVASPEPDIVTLDDNSNEPTFPYGFGRNFPIIPPSSNDLNLPPRRFNILATVAVVNHTEYGTDENYSPQSPEPSDSSPISTPPMNVSTFNSWETPHTTTDDNTFYSENEPRRVYWTFPVDETFYSEGEPRRIYLLSTPSPSSPPCKIKTKLQIGMSLPKRRILSQHVCEACGQVIPPTKVIPGPSTKD